MIPRKLRHALKVSPPAVKQIVQGRTQERTRTSVKGTCRLAVLPGERWTLRQKVWRPHLSLQSPLWLAREFIEHVVEPFGNEQD